MRQLNSDLLRLQDGDRPGIVRHASRPRLRAGAGSRDAAPSRVPRPAGAGTQGQAHRGAGRGVAASGPVGRDDEESAGPPALVGDENRQAGHRAQGQRQLRDRAAGRRSAGDRAARDLSALIALAIPVVAAAVAEEVAFGAPAVRAASAASFGYQCCSPALARCGPSDKAPAARPRGLAVFLKCHWISAATL